MLRQASTCCFGLLWLAVVVGTLTLHIVLARVVTPLQNLPENVERGVGEVLRFDYLERDATIVSESAAAALRKCGVVAAVRCPGYEPAPVPGLSNTSEQRRAILGAFRSSLAIIQRVANDKFFGTPELRGVAEELGNITAIVEQLSDVMRCTKSTLLYCGVYEAGASILEKVGDVKAEVHRIEDNEQVQKLEDYAGYLDFLHALPYLLVLAMFFLTCFWCQGGLCSTWCGCCVLVPLVVFWLLAFVASIVVVAAGVAFRAHQGDVRISELRGNPTVEELIAHLQADFPEFWDVAFADLAGGLTAWVGASAFLVVINILVALYACCLCACQPYRKEGLAS